MSLVEAMDESLEIVSSFPHPPRQFYEHLSVEEIKKQAPPEIKTELNLFGSTSVKKTRHFYGPFYDL
mgnify:CR=1 FL=1